MTCADQKYDCLDRQGARISIANLDEMARTVGLGVEQLAPLFRSASFRLPAGK